MKLYDTATAPSPRRVRIYLAEKGIDIPIVPVDLAAGQHKSDAFRALNPFSLVPVLELDDGDVVFESMAICRYLEDLHPEPPLFGRNALEKAQVEMWSRVVELELYRHVANAFRHGHPRMAGREVPQIAELAATSPAKAIAALETFDRVLADRPFIAGEVFTVADITGLVTLDFMKLANIEIPGACANVLRWRTDLSKRPSAAA